MPHCAICAGKEKLHFEKGQWLCDDCRGAKEIEPRRMIRLQGVRIP